jgi:hypothetical protein
MADAATSESWRCSDRALTLRDEAFTPARGSTPKTPKRLSRTRDSRSASPYETAWRSKGPRQPSCRVAVLPKPSNDVQLLQIWTCLPGITVHGTSGPILVSHRQTLVERSYRISWQGVPPILDSCLVALPALLGLHVRHHIARARLYDDSFEPWSRLNHLPSVHARCSQARLVQRWFFLQ